MKIIEAPTVLGYVPLLRIRIPMLLGRPGPPYGLLLHFTYVEKL
jgi:hypothetical protein